MRLIVGLLLAASACAAFANGDPLKEFEAMVIKCQAQVDARPVDRIRQLPDGDWMRNLSDPARIAYDVRRTDSLVTPYTAYLRLRWSERSIRASTREAIAATDINTGSVLAGTYEIRYGYQHGRWRTLRGLVQDYLRLPNESSLIESDERKEWTPSQLGKEGWFSDCLP